MLKEQVKYCQTNQTAMADARKPHEAIWKEVAKYLVPHRALMYEEKQPGSRIAEEVFDGHAIEAFSLFCSGLMGQTAPQNEPFFTYQDLDFELREDREVRTWYEMAERATLMGFFRGGMYSAYEEAIMDIGSVGHSCVSVHEVLGDNRLVYKTHHPMTYWIQENAYGIVDTIHRKLSIPAAKVKMMFPKYENKDLEDKIKNNPNEKVDIWNYVYPAEQLDMGSKGYVGIYVMGEEEEEIEYGTYELFPYAVARINKASGELYGRGLGELAIYDCLSLNQISKSLLVAVHRSTHPPYNIPQEMAEEGPDLNPGGKNYYQDTGRIISPINVPSSFPAGRDLQEQKIDIVRKHFKYDYFFAISNLQREATATEIMNRVGEKALAVVGISTPIYDGILSHLALNTLFLEMRANRLMKPPSAVNVGSVVFTSMLAQVQEAAQRKLGHQSFLESLNLAYQMNQDVVDNVDWDEWIRHNARANRISTIPLRDASQIESIRAARAEQQMAQMQQGAPQ